MRIEIGERTEENDAADICFDKICKSLGVSKVNDK